MIYTAHSCTQVTFKVPLYLVAGPFLRPFDWLLDVFGFNATLTANVISWRSVTHMCFLAFSHQYLHNFSFQSYRLHFSPEIIGKGCYLYSCETVNPFPNDKFKTFPNTKCLQTTVSNLMKTTEKSPNGFKTLWEKEKLLVTSNFSFSHSVFRRLEDRLNPGLVWERDKCKISLSRPCRLTKSEPFSRAWLGRKNKVRRRPTLIQLLVIHRHLVLKYFFSFLLVSKNSQTHFQSSSHQRSVYNKTND